MSTKVVLTMLPFSNHLFTPPIQLAYLKGYLQQDKDIEAKIIDLEVSCYRSPMISRDAKLYWEKLWNSPTGIHQDDMPFLNSAVESIITQKPDLVGFSVTNTNYLFTRYVSEQIKKISPQVYIVYGGRRFCLKKKWRHAVANWHAVMADVDCIVKNEGEAALQEIVTIVKSGGKPEHCRGATIRHKNRIVDGGDRGYIEDLDTIPFPDFSDLAREDYLSDYIRILFSRGCSGRCSYCVENDYMDEGVRYRSPGNIVEEVKLRISQGYSRFQSCDLCINSDHNKFKEVCKSIIDQGLNVEFIFGEFKHSPLLTKEIFKLFRKAGFRSAVFGTESASQPILNKMRKGVKSEVIESNIKDAHRSGLEVILYLMVGFPGETEETFQETVGLLKRNKKYIDAIGFAAPTTICWGSGIYDNLDDYGINPDSLPCLPDRWESSDGDNCYNWRLDLSKKMEYYMAESGVPLVIFYNDGNPGVPQLARRLPQAAPVAKNGRSFKSSVDRSTSDLKEYSADIRINDISDKRPAVFALQITNRGRKEWRKGGGDWIRFGCRIYREGGDKNRLVLESRQEITREVISPGDTFYTSFLLHKEELKKGRYRVKFDLVNESKFWFEDLGSRPVIEYVEP
ncbi:MAG: B12-binding domain-containing radical SAM protein [Candidatus Omnitrophica bacterium]|nr:B12-binding domain-containing radical SAM protein [Candidatus Omnitrophota bacterium]